MVLHDSTTVIETIISIPMQLIGGGDWTVTEYVGYGGRDVILCNRIVSIEALREKRRLLTR